MARAPARLGAPALALIGHLESPEAYLELLSSARGSDLPPLRLSELEALLRVMDPLPVCDITLRSLRGASVRARYIDVGLLPESRAMLRRVAERVELACAEAAGAGARLGVLGGFTSIAARLSGGSLARGSALALTTGTTLTAAVIVEQVRGALGSVRDATVTVVGAAGDVGSAVSRLLHAGGARLRLVGRRPRPVAALARKLPGAQALDWADAAPGAEIVVLAASAALGSIPLDPLPGAALVLDAGHPLNATPDGRIRYAVAGRVVHALPPEADLDALLARYAPRETHACLGEGIALALEGRFEAFSRGGGEGDLLERAGEILAIASAHGITPAPLRIEDAQRVQAGSGDASGTPRALPSPSRAA